MAHEVCRVVHALSVTTTAGHAWFPTLSLRPAYPSRLVGKADLALEVYEGLWPLGVRESTL